MSTMEDKWEAQAKAASGGGVALFGTAYTLGPKALENGNKALQAEQQEAITAAWVKGGAKALDELEAKFGIRHLSVKAKVDESKAEAKAEAKVVSKTAYRSR